MTSRGAVLVVGVWLREDPASSAAHVMAELSQSTAWEVDQRWATIGTGALPELPPRTSVQRLTAAPPKFTVINSLLGAASTARYRYVMVCDDDILLPAHFLDGYLDLVERHDLALAQPARSHDSYIDHAFVRRLDGVAARRTNFVEIGPCFSVRADAFSILLPFDERSPMGWGLDLVWPMLLSAAGLRLGIVDATPVSHSLRKPASRYDYTAANEQMKEYLARRPHVSWQDAFFIHESYAQPA